MADALETEPAIASAVLGKALQAARAAEAARKVRDPSNVVAAFCAQGVLNKLMPLVQECAGEVRVRLVTQTSTIACAYCELHGYRH